MFATGDMHASMGDGELCFTGVEIAGEATIRFDVLKGKQATWPVTELADRWVVHGTAGQDFMEALDHAAEEAQRLLVDEWGFSPEEAFVFLSVACDARGSARLIAHWLAPSCREPVERNRRPARVGCAAAAVGSWLVRRSAPAALIRH